MPRLFNVSAQYLQPEGPESQSVAPGEGFEFTDEDAESIGVEWSATDPHAGLAEEKAFKTKRDSKSEASPAPEHTEPGDPGDTKEN